MIVFQNFIRIFISYIVFLIYSVNYLAKTFLIMQIKSYFTLYHPLIFLFCESSRNFQAVCLTFSCSLGSFLISSPFRSTISILLLSLSSQHVLFVSLVFATSAGRRYRSAISIELTFAPNEIPLSLASRGFLTT